MKNIFYRQSATKIMPSKWDIFALLIILSVLVAFAWSASHFGGAVDYSDKLSVEKFTKINVDIFKLPIYAIDTSLRMLIALMISVIVSFIFGAIAAKSSRAEKIFIPVVDILQSIPILGFLAITITAFLTLFPGSLWGAQLAVIFGIFTAQVWNMILSFYQSLKSTPKELLEVAKVYQLSSWQKFWKIEVPLAMPSLIWNMMMSMSASWFMVVASESIVVHFSSHSSAVISLPGIGSFINQANNQRNFLAIAAAVVTIFIFIIIYDQIIFKPLLSWSEKFLTTQPQSENNKRPIFLRLLMHSKIANYIGIKFGNITRAIINSNYFKKNLKKIDNRPIIEINQNKETAIKLLWKLFFAALIIIFAYLCWDFIYNNQSSNIGIKQTLLVVYYGLITALRIFTLIVITSIIWVPIGVIIGLKPSLTKKIQPYAQVFASFPVNILYGVFGVLVITFHLNFNIWCIVLMALGAQWYILFNVIAGASAIPDELKMAADNLQLKGILKWKKFLLPAIMPYYITGAISAAGGAWNASIISEYINWGHSNTIQATGIGSYISAQYHNSGNNNANIVLGVVVMCAIVLLTNKLLWQRLYVYSSKHFGMHL